jgi:hypothetical protein
VRVFFCAFFFLSLFSTEQRNATKKLLLSLTSIGQMAHPTDWKRERIPFFFFDFSHFICLPIFYIFRFPFFVKQNLFPVENKSKSKRKNRLVVFSQTTLDTRARK